MKSFHNPANRFAFVIPVYNHEEMVASVVEKACAFGFPVIVVNDGSTDHTLKILQSIQGITILNHETNLGKGAALKTGFREAEKRADWAITIDADGQHNPQETSLLLSSLEGKTRPIVIGMRNNMDGKDVPWTSRFGRMFSNFWVFASGGSFLKDTQSGFRIYPLPEVSRLKTGGDRYQYEVEILAKAGWAGIPVVEVPVSVSYCPGTKRVTHFKPFLDFMRNSKIFTILITQRILIPRPIRRRMITKSHSTP
jgi:glycosyltransferase involved in cell wall biosynthesis